MRVCCEVRPRRAARVSAVGIANIGEEFADEASDDVGGLDARFIVGNRKAEVCRLTAIVRKADILQVLPDDLFHIANVLKRGPPLAVDQQIADVGQLMLFQCERNIGHSRRSFSLEPYRSAQDSCL